MITERENIASENGMSIEFVNWFFDNKKAGCGNVWFMMMAAMWEGWKPQNEKFTESDRYGRQADITIENLERKLEQLAAELSAVDAIHNDAVFITDDHYEQCPPEVQKMIRSLAVLQIPSYKTFLAEVRASGVEQLASLAGNECQRYKSVGDRAGMRKWKSIVVLCSDFAAQLRQGVAHE